MQEILYEQNEPKLKYLGQFSRVGCHFECFWKKTWKNQYFGVETFSVVVCSEKYIFSTFRKNRFFLRKRKIKYRIIGFMFLSKKF